MPLTFGRRTEEAVITYHPLSMALKCAAGLHSAYVTLLPLALYACFAAKRKTLNISRQIFSHTLLIKANVESDMIFEGE